MLSITVCKLKVIGLELKNMLKGEGGRKITIDFDISMHQQRSGQSHLKKIKHM